MNDSARQPVESRESGDYFDLYFTRLLKRLDPGAEPPVFLAAAAVRKAVGEGHACLDLAALCPPHPAAAGWAGDFPLPADPGEWQAVLGKSSLVGDGMAFTPLVLDGTRLYLRRYWQYEQEVAARFRLMAGLIFEPAPAGEGRSGQETVVAGSHEPTPEHLRAAASALHRGLTVISGGPGTGKTSVVAGILALVQASALAGGAGHRILLLAPTGKAAAKLAQTIAEKLEELAVPAAVKKEIPRQASTIHRVLGERAGSFDSRSSEGGLGQVHADITVIDEASMIDLSLLHRLLRALPEKSRLILLGDSDQLASVEAGSVFSDICEAGMVGALPEGGEKPPLAEAVVHLTRSFRFAKESGIGALARLVKKGEADRAVELLASGRFPDLALLEPQAHPPREALAELIMRGYGPLSQAREPLAALQLLDRFRILCAHRHGPEGAEKLNELALHLLQKAGLLRINGDSRWYQGRPVIITANCYPLGLFNGDTGILWPDRERGGELRAFFHGPEPGTLRSLAPSRLPPHDTAYSLTIHKSQGSEFDEALVLLPPEMSPVLSRELFYTALTRARTKVTVCGDLDIVRQTVARRVERGSGLADLLRRPV